MCEEFENKIDLPEWGFESQIFSNFPAQDLNFHVKWGARASKRDRTLRRFYRPHAKTTYCKIDVKSYSEISLYNTQRAWFNDLWYYILALVQLMLILCNAVCSRTKIRIRKGLGIKQVKYIRLHKGFDTIVLQYRKYDKLGICESSY